MDSEHANVPRGEPGGVSPGRQVAPPVTSPGHFWHFQGVATAGKRRNRRFTGDPYDDLSSSATHSTWCVIGKSPTVLSVNANL